MYEERPELETKFFHLIENVVNDRSKIRDLEDKCLDLLHSSEGNILDDEELISTIEDSKNTANTIQRKVEQSEGTRISSINIVITGYSLSLVLAALGSEITSLTTCLEACHIDMSNHALNRDDGTYLPQEYIHLFGR